MRGISSQPLRALIVLLFFSCSGCVSNLAATGFGTSVSALRQQTDVAFTGINDLVVEDQIQRAGQLDRLNESDFAPLFTRQSLGRIQTLFDQLQIYSTQMAALTSDERPKEFEAAFEEFGTSLAKVAPDAMPGPGVQAAVQEFGRLIVKAKAQRDAVRIARETDPAVQRICSEMAALISSPSPVPTTPRTTGDAAATTAPAAPAAVDPADELPGGRVVDPGIRTNVLNHWTNRSRAAQLEFTAMQNPTPQQKQERAAAFVKLLQKRDAQLDALDSLQQSFLQLGQAHAALARGDSINLLVALTAIRTEVQHTRELFDKFEKAKQDQKKKEAANG